MFLRETISNEREKKKRVEEYQEIEEKLKERSLKKDGVRISWDFDSKVNRKKEADEIELMWT